MKCGSIGEIPPSTILISGFTFRIARAAAIAMVANIFQSGSILKSQCERLFGSFHNMTASTMPILTFYPFRSLESASQFSFEDVLSVLHDLPRLTEPGLSLRMAHNLQS